MVQTSNAGLDIFDNLKIQGTKRWRTEPPLVCPYCSEEDSIYGVEVIAAYDGTLYWECESCEEKMLRFTKRTTVKHLAKTDGLYIDLERLKDIWEEEPN
tara:strand:- start:6085 stop:6381 length:297 start_codon:yes stop_codon:yes gene_type:complete